MIILLIFFILGICILFFKNKNSKITRNIKLYNFKKKLLSKETNIEKIFLREEEKSLLNPNININIGIYEKEENIIRKSNIHRSRLSKFMKSKLNGEMIFMDEKQNIFKYVDGKKKFL